MNADRLLVTGGAGFIGCNFVRLVLEQSEARVVVLDKLTYAGSLLNLAGVVEHPRFAFVRGDIAERDQVREAYRVHRPTHVLNFAAETHVDRSIDDPAAFVRTNVAGTFELLEGARRYLGELEPPPRERFRLLHVSTDEVFGSLGREGRFTETTPYAPTSPYSASKAGADHLVRAYHRTYGLPTLLTNCSNNYGPYQFPEKLVPLMILNALEGRELPIYGDGSNVRDWIHVEDHCRGILEVLAAGTPGESYNIGSEQERSNLEVVDALCDALESLRPAAANPALRSRGVSSYQSLRRFVADRPGHDQRYAIDPARIADELGFRPRFDFEEGMRATVAWYLEHLDWCEKVQAGSERVRLGLAAGAFAKPPTEEQLR